MLQDGEPFERERKGEELRGRPNRTLKTPQQKCEECKTDSPQNQTILCQIHMLFLQTHIHYVLIT